jgi:hypothetical protein
MATAGASKATKPASWMAAASPAQIALPVSSRASDLPREFVVVLTYLGDFGS